MLLRFDLARLAPRAGLALVAPCFWLACSSAPTDVAATGAGGGVMSSSGQGAGGASDGGSGVGGTKIVAQSFGKGDAPTCVLAFSPDDESKSLTPSSFMQNVGIAADGNAIVAGSFYGDLALPSGVIHSAGGWDIAIAKVDHDCHVVWAKRFGGPRDQFADALAIDPTGGFAITGQINGSIDFGTGPIAGAAAGDPGAPFLAKFDDDGNVVWAEGFGADQNAMARGLVVDAGGTIFMNGTFTSNLDLGAGELKTKHEGHDGGYLAAFDPTGATLWTRGYGLESGEHADSILSVPLALDPSGGVLLGGGYAGAGFDAGGATLPDAGKAYQTFFARYTSAGEPVQGTSFPSAGDLATLMSIDVDPAGDVLIAGVFRDQIQIGHQTLVDPMTVTTPDQAMRKNVLPAFVARLAPSGEPRWIKFAGEEGSACGVVFGSDAPIARFDAHGNVLLTGCFAGKLDLGGGVLEVPDAFAGDAVGGLFIATLDAHGNHLNSRVLGPGAASGWGIAPIAGGGAALTGGFLGNLDVNGKTLHVNGLPNTFLTWLAP